MNDHEPDIIGQSPQVPYTSSCVLVHDFTKGPCTVGSVAGLTQQVVIRADGTVETIQGSRVMHRFKGHEIVDERETARAEETRVMSADAFDALAVPLKHRYE